MPEQEDLFTLRSTRPEVEEFVQMWNGMIHLPKIMGTDRQYKAIREAMLRPFFRNNWRECIKLLWKCKWLLSNKRKKFQLDWFLIPDNFDKIMEGHYLPEDQTKTANGYTTESAARAAARAGRDDDGNEFII